MSDTPETDAALYPMNQVDIVWPDFARKLERERDEVKEKYRWAVIHWQIGSAKMERERDEAREELSDWKNAALHVESDHPDEKHCGCVPVLRKLLVDARSERDDALTDRANGDIATMTTNHYERILRERDEAIRQRNETNESSVFTCNFYYEEKLKAERERDQLKQLLAADSERVDAYLGVCIERDEAIEKHRSSVIYWQRDVFKMQRERDEALAEIQRLRLDAQREAEQHDRMVKELEGLYDQLAKTKSSNEHICSLSKDLMGNCIICDG